jgi:pimeloyl-ACP methyl ester carboxylesterase
MLISQPVNIKETDNSKEPIIYLFPGLGADCRLFGRIDFPFDTVHLELPVPGNKTDLHEYAMKFIPRIDPARPAILIGVSLGGMICSELADTLDPERVILISSAKHRNELPAKYRFQRYIPFNRIIPAKTTKNGALYFSPRVEPERKQDSLFRKMLSAKDPQYLKRTVNMIINWKKRGYDKSIFHIHGDADSTLPIKNIDYTVLLNGGTHMMIYIRGNDISSLINRILTE